MKGFTLIELLVVFSILGILGSIGLEVFREKESQDRNPTRCTEYNSTYDFCFVDGEKDKICYLEGILYSRNIHQVDCEDYSEQLANLQRIGK